MSLFRLAWRNVWRQRRRTLLLVIVVAYATLSTVFFWGFTEGQNESMLTNQARFIQAPAMVMNPNYLEDPDPQNALESLDILPKLLRADGIRGAAPRLDLFGVIRSAYTGDNVLIRGIDPRLEDAVSNIPQKIDAGRMLASSGEVVLGEGLAKRLDVRIGERIALDASSLAGPQALGLIMVGTINANVGDLDQGLVLIHLDDARTLTGVTTATAIALDIPRGKEDKVAMQVDQLFTDDPKVKVYGLSALMGSLTQMIEANTVQMIPILILFALFAALAVTSTLFVSVLERQKEFGMMSAIGTKPPSLAIMILLEALVTTVVGWLVGLIIGYALTWFFGVNNIFGPLFASMVESFADFGMSDELYTTSRPIYAAYAALTIVFALIFALLIPAMRVLRIKPAQAMRDA